MRTESILVGTLLLLAVPVAHAQEVEPRALSAEGSATSDDSSSSGRGSGDAEPSRGGFRVHATGAAAKAIGGYQETELSWGGAGVAALEWGPSPVWGIQLEASYLGLGASDVAPPIGVAALDGASGTQVGLGVRVRPWAPASPLASPAGLWLSAAGGLSITGSSVFPALDAFVGYDFFFTRAFGLGPTLGYLHVFDTESGPRADDGSIVLLGVHATFDFAPSGPRQPDVVDRDHDGILDGKDRCPDQPEDRDGFEDEDGCPDLDDDRDGVLDSIDRCVHEPEDRDGFEDEDGCPDSDNDQDDVLDGDDACPTVPEDKDGFQDADGCPDEDNDGDKIPDTRDLCPNEPETLNGFSDNDGCPDEEHVRVVGDKIELDQKIHFWSDSAVIRGVSYPVLNKLAQFLNEHREYVHVDVEGHADERGPDDLNQKLSAARANSVVEFLVSKGVERARLASAGFGSSRPLVEGKSEHAWFMNRRVEFIVTREAPGGVASESSAPSTPPEAKPSTEAKPPADTKPSAETSEKGSTP